MKARSLLLALTLITTAAASASAQTAPAAQPPTFRSGASLVALNVTVQDNGKKYISGLQPDDFAVYEDGVKQDVRFFESTAVPVDLILLLDTSSSMMDQMDLVHEAAIGFLKTLRPGDRGAVVGFSDNVNVLQPLTDDARVLEAAVLSTRAHGSTALNNAIYIALKQFGHPARTEGEVRRQAIAVLSDGEDTASLISFDDVVNLARRTGVNIYTVSLRSPTPVDRGGQQGHRFYTEADYGMQTLARETGAVSYFPMPGELRAVYASIAQELANQYSIGYVPHDGRSDGRFRRVLVQIITRPGLRPRTRVGYTAKGGASAGEPNE